jgi:tetratricopeptide (TPR) repeat protein
MRRHSILWGLAVAVLAAQPPAATAAGSGVGSSVDMGVEAPRRTPEQIATSSYNAGLKNKARAQSYEAEAAEAAKEKDRAKHLKRARDQWKNAAKNYSKAIKNDPTMYVAMNELGFAYRKLGDYENSVRAYNTALFVKPGFAPAIEYRAEAFLALGLYEETKAAYLELYRDDQDHAALLMQAFDGWLAALAADAPTEARAFADWVSERKRLAEVTQVRPGRLERTW